MAEQAMQETPEESGELLPYTNIPSLRDPRVRDLSDCAFRVLAVICDHFPNPRPSVARLCELSGRSRAQVFKALKEISECEFVEKVQRFKVGNEIVERRANTPKPSGKNLPSRWVVKIHHGTPKKRTSTAAQNRKRDHLRVVIPSRPSSNKGLTCQTPEGSHLPDPKILEPKDNSPQPSINNSDTRTGADSERLDAVVQELRKCGVAGSNLQRIARNSVVTPEVVRAAWSEAERQGRTNPAGLLSTILLDRADKFADELRRAANRPEVRNILVAGSIR